MFGLTELVVIREALQDYILLLEQYGDDSDEEKKKWAEMAFEKAEKEIERMCNEKPEEDDEPF